ncbi:MerR family transcriptional regulator [Pseudonocardia sp. NPDC046786]|uniref:MerR family transcriptional regulator n=1 Tax=Pseudonocardia sp. NPDC046786 TaxID=3155471 RepID=UPI003407545B
MAWSTREIAELAGTTARSVRHYHQVGLLPEPERRSNGYKQYGVTHLIRLLRIKRLVDLGVGCRRSPGSATATSIRRTRCGHSTPSSSNG